MFSVSKLHDEIHVKNSQDFLTLFSREEELGFSLLANFHTYLNLKSKRQNFYHRSPPDVM